MENELLRERAGRRRVESRCPFGDEKIATMSETISDTNTNATKSGACEMPGSAPARRSMPVERMERSARRARRQLGGVQSPKVRTGIFWRRPRPISNPRRFGVRDTQMCRRGFAMWTASESAASGRSGSCERTDHFRYTAGARVKRRRTTGRSPRWCRA
jgi:hypothetical protein